MKPIYKVLLINVPIAILVVTFYFISGFLLGYGANSTYAGQLTRLYVIFGIFHLFLNFWLLYKFRSLDLVAVGITILELLAFYVAVFYYFGG